VIFAVLWTSTSSTNPACFAVSRPNRQAHVYSYYLMIVTPNTYTQHLQYIPNQICCELTNIEISMARVGTGRVTHIRRSNDNPMTKPTLSLVRLLVSKAWRAIYARLCQRVRPSRHARHTSLNDRR